MSELPKPTAPAGNLNTILLGIVLAAVLGAGSKTIDTAEKVSALQAAQVTRTEIDARISETNSRIEEVRQNYTSISVRVAALERGHPPNQSP